MNLRKALTKETVLLELKSDTKNGVIEEMLDLLISAGRIKNPNDRKEVLKVIMDRERKMSTGMQNGIAIPHGKTNLVDNLIAAVALKKTGIDFGALDGQPSKIFIMTLSPDTRTGPHIQFLAEISRQLNDATVRERILNAQSPEEIVNSLIA